MVKNVSCSPQSTGHLSRKHFYSTGQKEETQYFNYLNHNAIVRINVKLYNPQFYCDLPLMISDRFDGRIYSESFSDKDKSDSICK
jgi:hypothetical protein